jgi:PhzF family phenazine biosynthesis protein
MKLFQVDAFTAVPFKGNPAGVCLVADLTEDRLFQSLALEMNLAETAFLKKTNNHEYGLRWFTPEAEIEFCGHATMASAHILWEKGFEPKTSSITFQTLAGVLVARSLGDRIELDFPARNVSQTDMNSSVLAALDIDLPVYCGTDGKRYLIEVKKVADLSGMTPDYNALLKAGHTAFIVTCRSDLPEFDFLSRFFAPAVGINEDPVTGSAHSYLTPYWSEKLGKKIMSAYQASRRGGVLECEMADNGRVLLRGQAITVFEIDAPAIA